MSQVNPLQTFSSQRVFNIVATCAGVATFAALIAWQQTAEAPPQWLKQFAIAAWVAAMIVAVVGQQTRPRLVLRFVSALSALVCVIAIISDWSRPALPEGELGSTTLLDHLTNFMPSMIAGLEKSISNGLGSWAWDPVTTTLLDRPAWLLFAALAIITGYAGQPRHTARIFVN